MIATQRVKPFAFDFDSSYGAEDILKPSKQVALGFNQGSIFVLFDGDMHTGRLIEAFKFEKLAQAGDWIRWTLVSNSGVWFDGAVRETAVYQNRVFVRPTYPLISQETQFGRRVQFKVRLPHRYQVHHLGFVLAKARSRIPSRFIWDR